VQDGGGVAEEAGAGVAAQVALLSSEAAHLQLTDVAPGDSIFF
jgi:hypothetical protein